MFTFTEALPPTFKLSVVTLPATFKPDVVTDVLPATFKPDVFTLPPTPMLSRDTEPEPEKLPPAVADLVLPILEKACMEGTP